MDPALLRPCDTNTHTHTHTNKESIENQGDRQREKERETRATRGGDDKSHNAGPIKMGD